MNGGGADLPVIEKTAGLSWTPVHAKPRREKRLAGQCAAKGVGCYLPTIRRVHRYGRSTREFMIPMFPGYVFCHLDDERYQSLLAMDSIVRRLRMDDRAEESLIRELNDIMLIEAAALHREVLVRPELADGARVKAVTGPLTGVEGVVIKRVGQIFIAVNIEILGQSAAVEVDIGDLEVLD
jgi:transcription antitermination factor NusG